MIYTGTRHDEFREIVLVIDLRLHGKVPALITLTLFRIGGTHLPVFPFVISTNRK